jgi:hypothetical protein
MHIFCFLSSKLLSDIIVINTKILTLIFLLLFYYHSDYMLSELLGFLDFSRHRYSRD